MVVPGVVELNPTSVPVLVNPTKGTVGNGVGVFVAVKVAVAVGVKVAVAVNMGVAVNVAVAVGVFVGVLVDVFTGVDVLVAVKVADGVFVAVLDGVGVKVAVAAAVGVFVGVLTPPGIVTLPFVREATGSPSLNTNPGWKPPIPSVKSAKTIVVDCPAVPITLNFKNKSVPEPVNDAPWNAETVKCPALPAFGVINIVWLKVPLASVDGFCGTITAGSKSTFKS